MDPRSDKETLRAAIKERLRRMSDADRERESRSLTRRLLQTLPEQPGVLCVFYPMAGSEANIRDAFPLLLEQGWKLFFPRFEGAGFSFRRATSVTSLVPGRYGLMEPTHDDEPLGIGDVTVALIPGLGFSPDGGRIGRGNGGYDRWLKELHAKNPGAMVWGVAFDCQMVTVMPLEAHDERMDLVITPRGVIDPRSPGTGPR